MQSFFILLCSLLIFSNLEAQNYVIEGIVKDLQNGQPIKKAQVFVNNEIEKSVITDDNGKFKLENISKDHYFEHPFFGKIKRKETIRFLEIHTNHHLKIIDDILKS